MPTDEYTPAEAFHVGEYVFDEMEARGWTVADVLNRMTGDRTLNHCCLEFLECQHPSLHLGEFSERLAEAFDGTSAETWRNLDETWHRFFGTQRETQ